MKYFKIVVREAGQVVIDFNRMSLIRLNDRFPGIRHKAEGLIEGFTKTLKNPSMPDTRYYLTCIGQVEDPF